MVVSDPVAPNGERIKILDFGIAKLFEGGTVDIAQPGTKSNVILGTPRYMSPEQCRGAGKVDARSDVYSLGVMLYQMMCGRVPFEADAPGDLMVMHLRDEPPPVRQLAEGIPVEVADFCVTLLKKDPQARPAMADVARRLSALADTHRGAQSQELQGSADAATPAANLQPFPGGTVAGVLQPESAPGQSATVSSPGSTVAQSVGQVGSKSPRPRLHYALPVLLVPLLAAFVWLLRGSTHEKASAQQAVAVPAPASIPVEKTVPVKAARCRLESDPPGANVVRIADGQTLGATPLELEVQGGSGGLKLRLALAGYAAEELLLSPQDGAARKVSLTPQRRGAGKAGGKEKKGKGGKSIFDRLD